MSYKNIKNNKQNNQLVPNGIAKNANKERSTKICGNKYRIAYTKNDNCFERFMCITSCVTISNCVFTSVVSLHLSGIQIVDSKVVI